LDAPLENRRQEIEESGVLSLRSLYSAAGRVPVWIVTWGSLFGLSLIVALPWYAWFEGQVGSRYAPGEATGFLSAVFRYDHASSLEALNLGSAQSGAIVAFLAILLGVFFAGGWLQVILERTRGHSLRRFFYGGSRYFWRFFRVLLLTLVVLAFFGWLIYGSPFEKWILGAWMEVPEKDWSKLESLDSESSLFNLRATQSGLFALVFGFTLTWADYTRTRLALQNTHSSVWGGLTTLITMLRHPVLCLRPMLVLLLAEALVLFAMAWLVQRIEGGLVPDGQGEIAGTGTVWLLFVLSQLALIWRAVIRGARYHATAAVSQSIVRPLSRPDPWKESIGGPGGPRYPLEEGDEYGVAL